MRETRRQKRANGEDATFAAKAIDMTRPSDAKYAQVITSMSKARSRTAWDWYDRLGEIHYGVGRSAKVGGYGELGIYKLEKNGEIGAKVTTGLAGQIGETLYSPYGGSRGLIERFLTLMAIPADSYLIRSGTEEQPDGYDFVSADELKVPDQTQINQGVGIKAGQQITRITLPAGGGWGTDGMEERVTAAQFIGRVWKPSPRFVDVPDSPMRALDTECEMLDLLTKGLRSKLLSRLASNGIFYVPSEVNEARSAAPVGEEGEFMQNKVLNELIRAAVYAARNPESAEAAIPIFMSGPGIHAEQFRHIIMDQELYKTDMLLREELIGRILVGLDVQPTQVSGAQETNHWGTWSASEDELRVSVKPNLETMCWALTRLILWKQMQDAGEKPGKISGLCVWYDLSRAQSHMNVAEDARQLQDRILLSPSATREASGFEERHAPNPIEYIRMCGVKMADPYLATYGMAEAEKFDWEKIGSAKTGPDPASQAPDSSVQPGKGNPGSPSDNKTSTPPRLRPVSGGK